MASGKGDLPPIIIVRKKIMAAGHHGGAWKVAYADFVTAMMAFFMVMWLVVSQPQEVLGGIADYFKSPSAVEGQAATMSPGAMGPGGAGDAPINIFDKVSPKTGKGEDGEGKKQQTDEELRKAAAAAERKRLEELMVELNAAIEASQSLAPFKDQLLIDITPEGLRIQIVDKQNRPMFASGSFRLQDYTNQILDELAEYLASVPNRVAITGHTDVTAFGNGEAGYTNWELSADRANAARRSLINGGLAGEKFARVVGLASSALFDKTNPSNPINRRISIILLSQAAEEQTRKYDELEPDEASGAASTVDAASAGTPTSAAAPAPETSADPPLRDAANPAARTAADLAALAAAAAAGEGSKR